jgi:Putative Actinobacterial Holin-X, holin superfamily III
VPNTVVGGKPVEEQSVGQLFATVSRDLSLLIHDEIELAKTELKVDAKRAGLGAGFLGGAGFLALLATLFLSVALAFAFRGLGLPLGVGFLIVGALYLLAAGVLTLGGVKSMKKVSPPKRTIKTVKDDIAWIKKPTVAPATTERIPSTR